MEFQLRRAESPEDSFVKAPDLDIGTVIGLRTKTFAVIHPDTRRGVRVRLSGARFDQLVVGCADPEAFVNSLVRPRG